MLLQNVIKTLLSPHMLTVLLPRLQSYHHCLTIHFFCEEQLSSSWSPPSFALMFIPYLKEELIKKDNSLSAEVTKLQTWKQGYRNILMVGIVWYKSEVDRNVSMHRISIFLCIILKRKRFFYLHPASPLFTKFIFSPVKGEG